MLINRNKKYRFWLLGLLIFTLSVTSVGGSFATAAWAAEAVDGQAGQEEVKQEGNIAVGLAALGLIALLANKSDKDSDNSATQGSSGTVPTPGSGGTNPNTGTPAPQPAPTSPATGLTADEQRAVNLLNADRKAAGLSPLKVNLNLVRLAENYAQDMINRNYFSHYNPEGQSPFDRMNAAGISYRYAGENLAINSSVDRAEVAFMNSSGHRANILNPNFTEVGIGVRYKGGSVYVVQEFIGK